MVHASVRKTNLRPFNWNYSEPNFHHIYERISESSPIHSLMQSSLNTNSIHAQCNRIHGRKKDRTRRSYQKWQSLRRRCKSKQGSTPQCNLWSQLWSRQLCCRPPHLKLLIDKLDVWTSLRAKVSFQLAGVTVFGHGT